LTPTPHGPVAARARRLAAVLAAAAVGVLPGVAAAQSLTLLRAFQPPLAAACGSAPALPAATPDAARRAEAVRLGEAADVHMLAGELTQARDALRRAVALDAASAELAFRLARTYEELGDDRAAVAAYCRARALDLPPTERAEAEERVQAIAARLGAVPTEAAARSFAAGVSRYESGDVAGAEAAFTAAIAAAPGVAAAYHDRALARIRRGETNGAIADLDAYARLAPAAMTPALRDARAVLRRGRHSPSAALAAGIIPGGAQLYTGRPGRGALLAAIAAAGVYLAVDGTPVAVERTATDPFGNEYTYLDPTGATKYEGRALGGTMFVLSLLGGMLEGYFHAREGQVDVRRLMRAVAGAAQTADGR
jgi:tetratricopeptide (TPR) repeat protein